MIELGTSAPGFTLRDQNRQKVSLSDFLGQKVMIVFIPMAFTKTCQGELCQIRDNLARLESFDATVLVITCDSLYSNRTWAEQQGFSFHILSDFWPHGEVTRAYGCFDERFGVARRVTIVIDGGGMIREVIGSEGDEARDFDSYLAALAGV